jgi:hypothetical protein
MTPTPAQMTEWRKDFAKAFPARPLSASHQAVTDNDYVFAGYIRARTEQATEIAELKAKLAEVMPSNDPLIVWSVSSEVGFTLFKTLEDAQRYVGQFSASIGGGLYISETAVFGNIVKD